VSRMYFLMYFSSHNPPMDLRATSLQPPSCSVDHYTALELSNQFNSSRKLRVSVSWGNTRNSVGISSFSSSCSSSSSFPVVWIKRQGRGKSSEACFESARTTTSLQGIWTLCPRSRGLQCSPLRILVENLTAPYKSLHSKYPGPSHCVPACTSAEIALMMRLCFCTSLRFIDMRFK